MPTIIATYAASRIVEEWPDAGSFYLPEWQRPYIRGGLSVLPINRKPSFGVHLEQQTLNGIEFAHIGIFSRRRMGQIPDKELIQQDNVCVAHLNRESNHILLEFVPNIGDFDHEWMEHFIRAMAHYITGLGPGWKTTSREEFQNNMFRWKGDPPVLDHVVVR